MEEAIVEALKQAPGLVVLAWIVHKFLNHLKALNAERDEAAKHTRTVIEENTRAAIKVESATIINTNALNNMSHMIDGLGEIVEKKLNVEIKTHR